MSTAATGFGFSRHGQPVRRCEGVTVKKTLVGLMGLAVLFGATGTAQAADPPVYSDLATTFTDVPAAGDAPKGIAVATSTTIVDNGQMLGPAGVWMALSGSGQVEAFRAYDRVGPNPLSKSAATTATVGNSPQGVATWDGVSVFVTNSGSNTVSRVEYPTAFTSTSVTATIAVGSSPTGIAMTATHAYVANNGSNSVSVIDTGSNAVVTTIPVGAAPWGVTGDPSANRVYVANNGDNTVSVIDTTSNSVTKVVPVGSRPANIAVSVTKKGGKSLFVTNNGEGSVSVIDAGSLASRGKIAVGDQPWGIVTQGDSVFVANYGSNTVSAINVPEGRVAASIAVGSQPFMLAARGDVFVTNSGDSTVSVIDPAPGSNAVNWSSNKSRRTIVGMVTNEPWLTYKITAKKGSVTRKGTCKATNSTTVTCTVKVPKGKGAWSTNVERKVAWSTVYFGRQDKRFVFA